MSTHRDRGIDRITAERLLRGDTGGASVGPDALADLLAAAAAPGRPDELAGESAALTAFRQARPDLVGQPRRGSMIKVVLAKALTAKIAMVAAAAVAVGGGTAVAAATGHLPASLGGGSSPTQPTPSHAPATDQNSPAGNEGQQANATPSPSMFGLCQAYSAGAANDHGRALDNPAFSVLITNAGGEDQVADYCATVLANPPGNAPSTHPTGESGEHGQSATHPTGQPTSHPAPEPTERPTEHPTGPSDQHGTPTGTPSHPTP
jgi:hypothetical protein